MGSSTTGLCEALDRRILLAHIGLDVTFAGGGEAAVNGTMLVAPLQGGKVLAVGPDGAVRLNSDGTRDESFVDREARSEVLRQPVTAAVREKKLFVAGTVYNDQGLAALYVRKANLTLGTVDTSFGQNGVVTFVPVKAVNGAELRQYFVNAVLPTADGGVIVAITQQLKSGSYPNEVYTQASMLHKFTAAGVLDPTFGNKGLVTVDVLDNDYFAPRRLTGGYADGRFVLLSGAESSPELRRFNADGSLDTTFGNAGVVALVESPFNYSNASAGNPVVQADGKIAVSFSSTDISGETSFSFIRRLNSDGTPDTSFGDNGATELGSEGGSYSAPDIALDASNRIISTARNGELIRLTPSGEFDPTFDDDGFSPMPKTGVEGHEGDVVRPRLALDAAGNILVGRTDRVSRFVERPNRAALGANRVLVIDGTNNADTITASLAGDTLTVTINGETSTFAAADVDSFLVTAGPGNDRIDLSAANFAALVNAGFGDDSIVTGDGDDWINCDRGADTVDAGGGKDLVFGDDDADFIFANSGNDIVFGEYGDDVISGGDGNDRLYGGHDRLIESGEYTDPYDGDDSLSGNAGNDTVDGGLGDDRVAGNGGRDRVFAGSSGSDRVFGGTGGDWLYGQGGGDQLFGEGGNDRLYDDDFAFGSSTLRGGAGNDSFSTADEAPDALFGDSGHDIAFVDEKDVLTSIEESTSA
jgi:uncharacterized delta-60 repeat protein